MNTPGSETSEPIIIKKYANRRLYNTGSSSYITLEDLAVMIRDNQDFKVIDTRTGTDITRSILAQIIMEEESRAPTTMLPVSFLRQLIRLYGDSIQSLVPHYLDAAMSAFRQNHDRCQATLSGAFDGKGMKSLMPFEDMARKNLALFQTASNMFAPSMAHTASTAPDKQTHALQEEVRKLKEHVASLQEELEKKREKKNPEPKK